LNEILASHLISLDVIAISLTLGLQLILGFYHKLKIHIVKNNLLNFLFMIDTSFSFFLKIYNAISVFKVMMMMLLLLSIHNENLFENDLLGLL